MKKLILLPLFFVAFIFSGTAQDYNAAVGLRLGYPLSVTYKKFVVDDKAFEVFAGMRSRSLYREIRANVAYQIHKPLGDVDMLKWYWGFGGGLTIYSIDDGVVEEGGGMSIQANGYLGLEYTLEGTPLVLSLDWVPTISIGGFRTGAQGGLGALAVRYILE